MRTVSPNQPRTPIRGVRIADDLWIAVQQLAKAEGRTASDLVRGLLEQYVAGEILAPSPERPSTPTPEGR